MNSYKKMFITPLLFTTMLQIPSHCFAATKEPAPKGEARTALCKSLASLHKPLLDLSISVIKLNLKYEFNYEKPANNNDDTKEYINSLIQDRIFRLAIFQFNLLDGQKGEIDTKLLFNTLIRMLYYTQNKIATDRIAPFYLTNKSLFTPKIIDALVKFHALFPNFEPPASDYVKKNMNTQQPGETKFIEELTKTGTASWAINEQVLATLKETD